MVLVVWGNHWISVLKANSLSGSQIAAATVLFFLSAYFVGLLLGSLSHLLVEYPWSRSCPWTLAALRGRYGARESCPVERLFHEQFGFEIGIRPEDIQDKEFERAQHKRIEVCSRLCHQFNWARNFQLGAMGSRWDAEALSSRSIALGIAFPLLWSTFSRQWYDLPVLALIALAALRSYSHYRENRVLGKFDLFQTLHQNHKKGTAKPDVGTCAF